MENNNTQPGQDQTGADQISVLGQILAEAQKSTDTPNPLKTEENQTQPNEAGGTPPPSKPVKKKREPMDFATFMKLIGALFFVAIIFLGSFLAYIVFNPGEAVFFINTFGINPQDINNLLIKLVNASFGVMFFVISIGWLIVLFQAIWTPKTQKRKRTLRWLMATVLGILLFGVLTGWIYLYNIIDATDYSNLDGQIRVYDQDIYLSEGATDISRIQDTANMIGPITLYFDLSTNAKFLREKKLMNILSYEMNFDGAKCINGSSQISGSNPESEKGIICTFDEMKNYRISGHYTVQTNIGTTEQVEINFPDIEIRGLLSITRQNDTRGNPIITLDANSIRTIGNPRWYYLSTRKEVADSRITETIGDKPIYVCLKIFNNFCDRYFILVDNDTNENQGEIIAKQNEANQYEYYFSFTGVNIPMNQIIGMDWFIDNIRICRSGDESCAYTFGTSGNYKIKLIITTTGDTQELEKEIIIRNPLALVRNVIVTNRLEQVLNQNNYDNALKAFVLSEAIAPPETITFNAQDVIVNDPQYILDDVEWTLTAGGRTETKKGKKVDFTFSNPLRYTIKATYTFKSKANIPGIPNEFLTENVIVDIEHKNLIPKLNIVTSGDYVPVIVTVDASRSISTTGEIKKFIFDFGEGRVPTEGDSIQNYQYLTDGDKTITLTIVGENGEQASIKQTLVLKKEAKTIGWTSSISPAAVNMPVDFMASGTNGQVEEYIWNFGDGTPVSYGYDANHVFEKPGTYQIMLTVRYTDGTQQSKKENFTVIVGYD